MSPQEAVETSRWRSYPGNMLVIEEDIGDEVAAELERIGYRVTKSSLSAEFGGVQVIKIDRNGREIILSTGADMRREAQAIAW